MKLQQNHHFRFMKRAMELAELGRGAVSPNPLVGAVLVRDGKIIAENWHKKYGEGHAERNLLMSFPGRILDEDVLYVTLEPCCHHGKTPPCTDIILERGVKNIVAGLLDPNPEVCGNGAKILKKNGVEVEILERDGSRPSALKAQALNGQSAVGSENSANCELRTANLEGVLAELTWQNRFFFKWVRARRPWVALKIAQSLDGRVAEHRGKQLWLTGKESQEHVHRMRAQYDAILAGVKTVIADDPLLTIRGLGTQVRQPLVVVLDAALSIPMTSRVVRPGTILFRGRQFQRRISRKTQLEEKGVIVLEVDTTETGYLHLGQILDELAARGITSVYVEGGPSVWSSFMKEELVDEFMFYFAPKLLGNGVNTFEDLDLDMKPIKFRHTERLGDDVYWQGCS